MIMKLLHVTRPNIKQLQLNMFGREDFWGIN